MKDRVSDLVALIAELAVKHRLGPVGRAGCFARGDDLPDADIDGWVGAQL